jgi:hypothetical protein
MKRLFYNFITITSFLLALGTGGLWIGTQWQTVGYSYVDRILNTDIVYAAVDGIQVFRERCNPLFASPATLSERRTIFFDRNPVPMSSESFLGFHYHHEIVRLPPDMDAGLPMRQNWEAAVPYWFLLLVFLIAPLVWLRQFRQAPSQRDGFCHHCGYDLRSSIDRCPECGSPIEVGKIVTPP